MSGGRKILVVGSGGREHALAWRLLQSDSVQEVLVLPGNAGTMGPSSCAGKVLRNVSGDAVEISVLEKVDLVVIGPEVPLCEGLADRIRAAGVRCYGPSQAAASLEGSKSFMKDFCRRHGIVAARDVVVSAPDQLDAALAEFAGSTHPPVVKADGLCAGKGVVVAETMEEARAAAMAMLSGDSFGVAGATVVLEERLLGAEASIHAICDGERAIVLPVAQDHKRIFEGDRGPNTGGMGTYAPAPLVDAALLTRIRVDVVQKVVDGMKADGTPFVGTLFAGLMISPSGEPVVLEFNVRFGDPETQVLCLVVDGDFGQALFEAAEGQLRPDRLRVSDRHALCVVLASEGYPEGSRTGDPITGLDVPPGAPSAQVFHAGTALQGDRVVTAGGRVLGVTASGSTLSEARTRAYAAASGISFPGMQFRRDIGHRALD